MDWQLAIPGDSAEDKNTIIFQLFRVPFKRRRRDPGQFRVPFDVFPAAYFLAGEEFGVVAAVARITAIARNVVNLFPNPSLSWHNERFAVGALVRAVDDHVSSSSLDAKRRPTGRPRMD